MGSASNCKKNVERARMRRAHHLEHNKEEAERSKTLESNMSKCPICDKNCTSKIGLISHIYWKHSKDGYAFWLTVIAIIFGLFVSILVTTNTGGINYIWDKYILDKEPDMYITLDIIGILNNSNKIEYLNGDQKVEFLNKFLKVGIIPPWHNQIKPFQFNLEDDLNDKQWCLFWAFDNANKYIKGEDLPIDFKTKYQKFKSISSAMPSRETLKYLEENCLECLAYEIYGVNKGNRDIDIINFEICFPDEHFIIKYSEDIILVDDHCVRIKKENIIEKETFLGTVFVSTKEPIYWNIWYNPIRMVSGKFVSKGKEFQINNDTIARIISGLVPNCQMH